MSLEIMKPAIEFLRYFGKKSQVAYLTWSIVSTGLDEKVVKSTSFSAPFASEEDLVSG